MSSVGHAGFHEFTMHSRANCGGFNESISWQFMRPYWLLTESYHFSPKFKYSCDFGSSPTIEMTWRSAACHYLEGYEGGGWYVVGHHYNSGDNGKSTYLPGITDATDCKIYDGWWDAR